MKGKGLYPSTIFCNVSSSISVWMGKGHYLLAQISVISFLKAFLYIMPVSFLLIKRYGIVDHCRYTQVFQVLHQAFPFSIQNPQGILMKYVITVWNPRGKYNSVQIPIFLIIVISYLSSSGKKSSRYLSLTLRMAACRVSNLELHPITSWWYFLACPWLAIMDIFC